MKTYDVHVQFDCNPENAVERTEKISELVSQFSTQPIEEGSGQDAGWVTAEVEKAMIPNVLKLLEIDFGFELEFTIRPSSY